jgi:maltoporin
MTNPSVSARPQTLPASLAACAAVCFAFAAACAQAIELPDLPVEIGGYFRSGYGEDDQGGAQVGFKAPGAGAKYRLGNEAETYGELSFGKGFYLGGTADGPVAGVNVRLSVYNPYQESLSASGTDVAFPEAWAYVRNVLPSQPDAVFWAGNRFYRRHDIHVNDYFFYNLSGSGGGIEDVRLPFGKLALAVIGAGANSGLSSVPEPDAENEAGFSKNNLDVRLYDVPLPLGVGEFGLTYARADCGLDALGQSAPSSDGGAFTFLHTADKLPGAEGFNKLSFQFGTGAAMTFTSGFETFALGEETFIRHDPDDAWRVRVTEHLVASVGDSFAVGPVLVYELTDYKEEGGKVHWASAGVRPVWFLGSHFSLAAEAGVDWVKDEAAGTEGALYKATLAPQISLGSEFFSRPALRAYVTYARWDDDFVGKVGGLDYADANDGVVYGIQMETWW